MLRQNVSKVIRPRYDLGNKQRNDADKDANDQNQGYQNSKRPRKPHLFVQKIDERVDHKRDQQRNNKRVGVFYSQIDCKKANQDTKCNKKAPQRAVYVNGIQV